MLDRVPGFLPSISWPSIIWSEIRAPLYMKHSLRIWNRGDILVFRKWNMLIVSMCKITTKRLHMVEFLKKYPCCQVQSNAPVGWILEMEVLVGYRHSAWLLEQFQQHCLETMLNRMWHWSISPSQALHPEAMQLTTHSSAELLLWEVTAGIPTTAKYDPKCGVLKQKIN